MLNRQGQEDEALTASLRAARIDPSRAEAQNNAATIYLERGELDEARRCLRLAIDARPDFLQAHQNISNQTRCRPDDPHYAFLETQLVQRNALTDKMPGNAGCAPPAWTGFENPSTRLPPNSGRAMGTDSMCCGTSSVGTIPRALGWSDCILLEGELAYGV